MLGNCLKFLESILLCSLCFIVLYKERESGRTSAIAATRTLGETGPSPSKTLLDWGNRQKSYMNNENVEIFSNCVVPNYFFSSIKNFWQKRRIIQAKSLVFLFIYICKIMHYTGILTRYPQKTSNFSPRIPHKKGRTQLKEKKVALAQMIISVYQNLNYSFT